jgi:predicted oxidoreductase (fatty acid repression mutant protein)
MKNKLIEAIIKRRSIYGLKNGSPISDHDLKEILSIVLTNVPSAFNSQSARFVLLLNENHRKLWDITKEY